MQHLEALVKDLKSKLAETNRIADQWQRAGSKVPELQGRVRDLSAQVAQERHWRLRWEGEAHNLKGHLAIARGRRPPAGWLG